MEWKYKEGDKVMFTCTDSLWKNVGPVTGTVARRLTDLEADLNETGPMYEVDLDVMLTTIDGGMFNTYHAFEDELAPIN